MRALRIMIVVLVLIAGCSAEGQDPTAVSQRGPDDVFAIVDNCPSVQDVSIEVDGQTRWAIRRASPAPDTATLDIPLGRTPEGWVEVLPLSSPFEAGVRYKLRVGPDTSELDFQLSDLNDGQAFDGQSSRELGARSELITCDEVDDGGINSFGEFLFTATLLLILAFGVIGLVAWVLLKGLRRFVDARAGDRLAREPQDDQWHDTD